MRLLSQTVLSYEHFMYVHLVEIEKFDLIGVFDWMPTQKFMENSEKNYHLYWKKCWIGEVS